MEDKHKDIPAKVFDWIEKKAFPLLDDKERQEVLSCITGEEYNELHRAAMAVKLSQEAGNSLRRMDVKNTLMQHFDKTHGNGTKPVDYKHLFLKIAAVFFLFASGWLCHYLAGYRQNESGMVAGTDTVYVTQKTGDTILCFDTIYLKQGQSKDNENKNPRQEQQELREKRDATQLMPDAYMLPAGSRSNSPVSNPVQDPPDDSLVHTGQS